MAAPTRAASSGHRPGMLERLLGPAPQGGGISARANNLGIALWLATFSLPLFAVVYMYYGDPFAARVSLFALAGVALAAFWLHGFGQLDGARDTLTLAVYVLLLALIYRVGGARSPSLIWLVACPMIASAGGGARSGLLWSVAIIFTMLGVNMADAAGWFPPARVTDLKAVNLIGNVGFVVLVAVFLLLYERNNAAALRQLGHAMETIRLMAVSDELTGLNNRRELLRIALQQKLRADRYGTPLSYCLIDIDHFKLVNDTWGHLQGDNVLRGVAQALQTLVRGTDCLGRYGGEEFVYVLSDTDQHGALEFAERVRSTIEQVCFAELGALRVTLSIGVAQAIPNQSVEQGLARADTALYEAKRGGRNRVVGSARRVAA